MIYSHLFTNLGYGDLKTYKLATYATDIIKHEIIPLKRVIVVKLTKGHIPSAILFILRSNSWPSDQGSQPLRPGFKLVGERDGP